MDFLKWSCAMMYVLYHTINRGTAYTGTIRLDEATCHDVRNIYFVSGDVAFNVEWSGEKITRECTVIFEPSPSGQKTCIEVVSYQIASCDVQLAFSKFRNGENSDLESYSCKTTPNVFCGTSESIVVQLSLSHTYNLENSSFRLKTTTTNSSILKNSSVMAGAGVGIGVAVVMVILLVLAYRRRHAIVLAVSNRSGGGSHLMTSDADGIYASTTTMVD
ncbi:uncharacterized protein LOC125653533 isoform X2 [Ostrea edulis]|uniref:uncharacterized protein LOC125653533 isoform X2 n=1 Tax=Ostrea edulis TaxID=37623 RepID=UPI0024AF5BE4|nr:uncharacterized protein LOC125653533 isoform X2 [Ostrea edulis]